MKSIHFAVFVIIAILFSSCGRRGCTSERAVNYSDKAVNDDGSCHFECCVVFWNDVVTSQYLDTTDATYLDYHVNGEFIGRTERLLGSFPSFHTEPGCDGMSGFFPTTCIDMGTVQTAAIPYEVRDQNGNIVTSGDVYASGGYCVDVKIQY